MQNSHSLADMAFSDLTPARAGGLPLIGNKPDLKESVPLIDYEFAYKAYRSHFSDGMGDWRPAGQIGSRTNRVQGKNLYTHWSENDLLRQVSIARTLDATNPIAQGAVSKLVSFVLQGGATYKIVPKAKGIKPPSSYIEDGQQQIDDWRNEYNWQFEEAEHVRTAIVDGELLIDKARDEDTKEATCFRFEPEQVVQPVGKTEADGWRLGVQHQLGNVRKVLNYNINWGLGNPGNSQPFGTITRADRIIHYKRNVVISSARGVSDFFSNADDLDKVDRALDAIGAGAIAKAKIPYFRKHKEALPGAVEKFAEDNATSTLYNPLTQRRENRFNPADGTIADIPDTIDVTTMPQGSTLECIEAVNLLIRLTIAHRWSMPEFVASADSSNNNYASIMIAGSPFVIAVRQNQSWFCWVWRECMLWVIKVKIALKMLPADFLEYCDVSVKLPDSVISNALEDEQIRDIRYRNRAISPQTYAAQIQVDYDQESANWKEAVAADPMLGVSGMPDAQAVLDEEDRKSGKGNADKEAE